MTAHGLVRFLNMMSPSMIIMYMYFRYNVSSLFSEGAWCQVEVLDMKGIDTDAPTRGMGKRDRYVNKLSRITETPIITLEDNLQNGYIQDVLCTYVASL